MAIPAALLTLGKQIIAKAVYTKVTKEFNKVTEANNDGEIIEIVDSLEDVATISKGKVSAWAVVAVALTGFAETQGWLPPSVSGLIQTLLSNPEVIEGIEGNVE